MASVADLVPFPGSTPDWLTEKLLRRASQAWTGFNRSAPQRLREVFVPGQVVNPFERYAGLQGWRKRMQVADQITSDAKLAMRVLADRAASGQISWGKFAEEAADISRLSTLQAAQLGMGRDDVWSDPRAMQWLDELVKGEQQIIDRHAGRALAGDITGPQAAAWTSQAERGATRSAVFVGASAHMGEDPVRWVLAAEDVHCVDCPGYAQTYASIDDMLAETGGWPGSSNSECHGNCLCAVEAAVLFSTERDTSGLLVARGA